MAKEKDVDIKECLSCGVAIEGTLVYECKQCGTFCCDNCGAASGNCHECGCSVEFVGTIKSQ